MRPRRHGVATYLQTFILVAVALAGSLLAYNAVSAPAHAGGGPALRILDASVRQEAGFAVERFAVSDSGTTKLPYFAVLNPGLDRTVSYCYVLSLPNGTEIHATCPAMEVDPTKINLSLSLTSGSTAVVMMLFEGGNVVAAGSSYALAVTAPGGAVATQQVVATTG